MYGFKTMADCKTQIFGDTITPSPGCWIYKVTLQYLPNFEILISHGSVMLQSQ